MGLKNEYEDNNLSGDTGEKFWGVATSAILNNCTKFEAVSSGFIMFIIMAKKKITYYYFGLIFLSTMGKVIASLQIIHS